MDCPPRSLLTPLLHLTASTKGCERKDAAAIFLQRSGLICSRFLSHGGRTFLENGISGGAGLSLFNQTVNEFAHSGRAATIPPANKEAVAHTTERRPETNEQTNLIQTRAARTLRLPLNNRNPHRCARRSRRGNLLRRSGCSRLPARGFCKPSTSPSRQIPFLRKDRRPA